MSHSACVSALSALYRAAAEAGRKASGMRISDLDGLVKTARLIYMGHFKKIREHDLLGEGSHKGLFQCLGPARSHKMTGGMGRAAMLLDVLAAMREVVCPLDQSQRVAHCFFLELKNEQRVV